MLGLLRLAVRRALLVEVETEPEPGGTASVIEKCGLRVVYPTDLDRTAQLLVPSRRAVRAVLELEVGARVEEAHGVFIVSASDAAALRARMATQ